MMMITYGTNVFDGPFNTAVGYIVVPFENGISRIGEWLENRQEEFTRVSELLEENEALKEQVNELLEQNTILTQEKYELTQLRELMEISDEYDSYQKVGARIIAKDSGNWYSSFVINKGTNDGLAVDMNVIAGGGLVGRISGIGPNWARVTSIISDGTFVSGQILATGDTLMVEGSLELMEDGLLSYSQLKDVEGTVVVGDKIVTSQISDKYLPGLLIGYVQSIEIDTNNLTKSGYLTPVVDFEHLSTVLVVTDLKNQDYK
jgi:rod shape-determining protein MreC